MKSLYNEAKQHLGNFTRMISRSSSSFTVTSPSDKHELEREHEHETDYHNNIGPPSASTIMGHPNEDHQHHHHHHHHHLNGGEDDEDAANATSSPNMGLHNHNNNFISSTTYDTLQRPFKYDKLRGRWSSAADFYFACTSHAFGSVVFSELSLYVSMFAGAYALLPYLFGMLLYAIPIFGIQTFLGQFSSSGSISVFRVAPIFKGIGYSILFHNLASLAYYSVIASMPLVYAIYSLQSVIPWMSCYNHWNTENCSSHDTYDEYEDEIIYPHSSVEFFRFLIRSDNNSTEPLSISWPVFGGVMAIWVITLLIMLKRVSFIGKFLRCTCLILMTLFFAIFVHLLMHLDISWKTIKEYMEPTLPNSRLAVMAGVKAAVLMPLWLLGPGCGSVLTLASHNRFRQDSEKLIYWVAITFIIITQMGSLFTRIAMDHFEDHVALLHVHITEEHNFRFIYICFAYLFGSFNSLPHFWSFLFFLMLFLAELSAVIVQMMTVLVAVFDEFESLRRKKTGFTIGLVLALLLVSIYFCTKQGFQHLHSLPDIVTVTHLTISILLLFISTWIYGRERFQCDLQFMLGRTISNFKVFLLRFVTPFVLGFSIGEVIYSTYVEGSSDPPSLALVIAQCVIFATVPLYMIYKVSRTTGSLRQRVKQCFAPHDWHPVDADNRRFYEEIMGTSEMLVIISNNYDQEM